jgi:hypothetical protein
MLQLPILCYEHNQLVASRCDAPLIGQMAFFVNALKVVKARGEDGVPIKGTTIDGDVCTISRDQRPEPAAKITERSPDGRPVKAHFPTMTAAQKFIKSMGLSPTDSKVSLEKERFTGPTIHFAPAFGGSEGFRGILKVAYEYARGILEADIVDAEADEGTRHAILTERNPSGLVRWLPYERLPTGEVNFYSHRLAAWQSEGEALVIVELFNTLPFVARLPGLGLGKAAYFIQGVKGEKPIRGDMLAQPAWSWDDIPEHAQPLMFSGVQKRLGDILRTRAIAESLEAAREVFTDALHQCGADASDEDILRCARAGLAEWRLNEEQGIMVEGALVMLVSLFRSYAIADVVDAPAIE